MVHHYYFFKKIKINTKSIKHWQKQKKNWKKNDIYIILLQYFRFHEVVNSLSLLHFSKSNLKNKTVASPFNSKKKKSVRWQEFAIIINQEINIKITYFLFFKKFDVEFGAEPMYMTYMKQANWVVPQLIRQSSHIDLGATLRIPKCSLDVWGHIPFLLYLGQYTRGTHSTVPGVNQECKDRCRLAPRLSNPKVSELAAIWCDWLGL